MPIYTYSMYVHGTHVLFFTAMTVQVWCQLTAPSSVNLSVSRPTGAPTQLSSEWWSWGKGLRGAWHPVTRPAELEPITYSLSRLRFVLMYVNDEVKAKANKSTAPGTTLE